MKIAGVENKRGWKRRSLDDEFAEATPIIIAGIVSWKRIEKNSRLDSIFDIGAL